MAYEHEVGMAIARSGNTEYIRSKLEMANRERLVGIVLVLDVPTTYYAEDVRTDMNLTEAELRASIREQLA